MKPDEGENAIATGMAIINIESKQFIIYIYIYILY